MVKSQVIPSEPTVGWVIDDAGLGKEAQREDRQADKITVLTRNSFL